MSKLHFSMYEEAILEHINADFYVYFSQLVDLCVT